MNAIQFKQRLAAVCGESLPLPGAGDTPGRLRRMLEAGREDLSLAKLAEAHWDAIAILAEAGVAEQAGAIYGVWASEIPGSGLRLEASEDGYLLSGTKMFCSGAGLVDRALVSVRGKDMLLVDVDLRGNAATIAIDGSGWHCDAFRMTHTSTLTFNGSRVGRGAILGGPDWYVERVGFWHGACGPAACWAGGVAGLLDYATQSKRDDPHTLAHLGAMHANVWGMTALLEAVGREIDLNPADGMAGKVRALQVRHLVEQACSDTLKRFARAYGPFPLAMHAEISRRYQEADLYLRQSHAERDLEYLARTIRGSAAFL